MASSPSADRAAAASRPCVGGWGLLAGGAGAADRRGGERGESEGAWRRGGSRSRSWPLLASDCPSPCSMAQVMMAYVPPDEDPDVDGPVDFEPDAWELADLARWDGRTSRPEARRFAFAKGPVLGTRVIACALRRVYSRLLSGLTDADPGRIKYTQRITRTQSRPAGGHAKVRPSSVDTVQSGGPHVRVKCRRRRSLLRGVRSSRPHMQASCSGALRHSSAGSSSVQCARRTKCGRPTYTSTRQS